MKKWFIKQLTEPTAWLCAAIIAALLLTRGDTIAICICIVGILLDESAMKAWCAKVAPGIATKIEEWSR